jgi:hypothetical protein
VIGVLRALAATVFKMFAADLWLTLTALAAVGFCAAGLRFGFLGSDVLPFALAGGVLVALVAGVARGARR